MNDAKLRTQKANYCSDWLINYLRRSLNLERFQLFRILKIAQKNKNTLKVLQKLKSDENKYFIEIGSDIEINRSSQN